MERKKEDPNQTSGDFPQNIIIANVLKCLLCFRSIEGKIGHVVNNYNNNDHKNY